MTEIEAGQVWTCKGGTGFGDDQITILADVSNHDNAWDDWEIQKGTGTVIVISDGYIHDEFAFQAEHPTEWEFTDLDADTLYVQEGGFDTANLVFETSQGNKVVLRPDDINDLIHWLTTHQHVHGGK